MSNRIKQILIILSIFAFQACDSDDNEQVIPTGSEGFFITNEGAFGGSNASLSFYNRNTNTVNNNLFFSANERPLGDQVQSMALHEGKGYIAVQNSAKIEIIDASDFTSINTISDNIFSPRYFLGITSGKGYLTDWGSDGFQGSVKVIDLNTNSVIKSISTGQGANQLLIHNNLAYVANNGGRGRDSTISVIDTNADAIVSTIVVGNNPNSLQLDAEGNIWVTASGYLAFDENFAIIEEESIPGSISKITDGQEVLRLYVDKVNYNIPNKLSINKERSTIYYTYDGGVYSLSTSASSLPSSPLISKNYYGLAIDPITDNIIGFESPNFSSSGAMDVYSSQGNLIESYEVGIGPNGCAFK